MITASGTATAADGGSHGPEITYNSDRSTNHIYQHTPGSETPSVSIHGETATPVASYDWTTASLSMKRLVKVSTNGDKDVPGPWWDFDLKADLKGERFNDCYVDSQYNHNYQEAIDGRVLTSGSYDAQTDTRDVFLTRSGAPAPKQKDDPTLNIDHDEWGEADGTRHGHSRWSYTERISTPTALGADYSDQPVPLYGFITAQPNGAWSNNLTGVWSNPDAQDRQPPQNANASHAEFLPNRGALLNSAGLETGWGGASQVAAGWYDTPSKGDAPTVTYKLTDNADGATATAKYVFHLHDEWEHKSTDTTHTWGDGTHSGEERWTKTLFDSPEQPYTNDGGTTSKDVTWEIKTTITNKLEASIGADFKAYDAIHFGASASVDKVVEITKPTGVTATLAPGERAIACLQLMWTREFYLLDHYNVGGFDPNTAGADKKWSKWHDDEPDVIAARWWRSPANEDPNQISKRPSSSPHQFGPQDDFNPAPPPPATGQ